MILALDSNVLVYGADERSPLKQQIALELIAALAVRRAPIALQVVGEFQNALRRRLKQSPLAASRQAENVLAMFAPFPYGRREVESALARSSAGLLSYWDAVLVASAETAGVDVLFSEDMQDGARYGAVTVVNPFAPEGLSARARELLDL